MSSKIVKVEKTNTQIKYTYKRQSNWNSIWSFLFFPLLIFIVYQGFKSGASPINGGMGEQFKAGLFYIVLYAIIVALIFFVGSVVFASGKGLLIFDDFGMNAGKFKIPYAQFDKMYLKIPQHTENNISQASLSFYGKSREEMKASPYQANNFFRSFGNNGAAISMQNTLSRRKFQLRMITPSGDLLVAKQIRLETGLELLNLIAQQFPSGNFIPPTGASFGVIR